MGGFHWANYAVGNTAPTSYVPSNMLPFTSSMTFYERIVNTVFNWYWDIGSEFYFYPQQESLKNQFFGPGLPHIKSLRRSASLVLVNNHFTMNYPRPLVPNFVEVGGMHVQPPKGELSEEIKDWLDGAKEGVIYFSMGSNLKADQIPEENKKGLMQAFEELPQRILMKWDSDTLPGKPQNVKVSSWLAQQDVLGNLYNF
jgi:UDP:flavonoid glycosyltransferase YjiC (YdhE family)